MVMRTTPSFPPPPGHLGSWGSGRQRPLPEHLLLLEPLPSPLPPSGSPTPALGRLPRPLIQAPTRKTPGARATPSPHRWPDLSSSLTGPKVPPTCRDPAQGPALWDREGVSPDSGHLASGLRPADALATALRCCRGQQERFRYVPCSPRMACMPHTWPSPPHPCPAVHVPARTASSPRPGPARERRGQQARGYSRH